MTTLVSALMTAVNVYEIIIIIRVFMSWVNPNPDSPPVRFVLDLTDPYLGFLEGFMPRALLAPLNFTPIVALLLLGLLKQIIFAVLL